MDTWQEIDKLRTKIANLEHRLAAQTAILATHPVLRVGDPQEITDKAGKKVYRLKERTVTVSLLNEYLDVQLLPGDPGPALCGGPVAFTVGDDGERYVLPQADRIILVEDLGSETGKQVEINTAGAITTPPGSETLDLVVTDADAVLAAGKIYLAQKIQSVDGITKKYLVFPLGGGGTALTFVVDNGDGTGTEQTFNTETGEWVNTDPEITGLLIAINDDSSFYEATPPFRSGLRYLAQSTGDGG